MIGDNEIRIGRFKRRPAWFQSMSRDLVHVELTGEHIVTKVVPECVRFIPSQTAWGGCTHVNEWRQEIARSWMKICDVVNLAVDSTVNGVNHPVA